MSRLGEGSDYSARGDGMRLMRPRNWFTAMLGAELAQK